MILPSSRCFTRGVTLRLVLVSCALVMQVIGALVLEVELGR